MSQNSIIQAICFDLDDTLWPVKPVIRHAEDVLQRWLCDHCPRLAKKFSGERLRQLRWKILQEQPELHCDLLQLRRITLQHAATQVGYDMVKVEQALSVFHAARHRVKLYNDVLPVLGRLKHRYRLCSLTNGSAEVHRVGLQHLLTLNLRACDVGTVKPHPEMFLAICERLGLPPEKVLYVGDDPIADVNGALNAGLSAVWLNRQKREWTAESACPEGLEVRSLQALESWLGDI